MLMEQKTTLLTMAPKMILRKRLRLHCKESFASSLTAPAPGASAKADVVEGEGRG